MGPPQHQAAPVGHEPQLDAGPLAVGRRRGRARPHDHQAPQLLPTAQNPHAHLVRAAGVLEALDPHGKVVLTVAVRVVQEWRVPVHDTVRQVDGDEPVPAVRPRVQDAQGDPSKAGAVVALEVGQRRHRLVDDDVVPAGELCEGRVLPQHSSCVPELLHRGVGPRCAGPYVEVVQRVEPPADLDRAVLLRVEDQRDERGVPALLAPENLRGADSEPPLFDLAEQFAHSAMAHDGFPPVI